MAAGSIEKRTAKDGTASYRVTVELPADPMIGERERKRGTFRTKKEAEAARAAWVVEVDIGIYVKNTTMTVGEYLPFWLNLHRHDLRASTIQQYSSLIRAHLIPALGSILLTKLQPAHLVAMYADKRDKGRRDGSGGLAPRSVRHLHVVMHEALAFAVKQQMLARNVTDAVDAPKFTRKEMTTWTPEHIRRFLATAQYDTYSPIWLLMLTTGLRRGEALGLRWRDIDLVKGRLNVAQSVIDVGGHVQISEPKTRAGRRQVRLSPTCVDALRAHRESERQQKIVQFDGTDFVFTTGDGKPVQPRVLSRAFDVLQKKAKVPRIRLHDIRHTHATLLFNDGKNIKMISQRLGHSDVGITLSVYAHLADDAQEEASGSIDGLIFGSSVPATGTD